MTALTFVYVIPGDTHTRGYGALRFRSVAGSATQVEGRADVVEHQEALKRAHDRKAAVLATTRSRFFQSKK